MVAGLVVGTAVESAKGTSTVSVGLVVVMVDTPVDSWIVVVCVTYNVDMSVVVRVMRVDVA